MKKELPMYSLYPRESNSPYGSPHIPSVRDDQIPLKSPNAQEPRSCPVRTPVRDPKTS